MSAGAPAGRDGPSARRRRIALAVGLAVLILVVFALLRGRGGEEHYTGFVEGEERVLRSEVSGRVREVAFREGDRVPADAVIARLDDLDIAARIASREQEIAVLEAQASRQAEEIALTESTWRQDLAARNAEQRQAQAEAELAGRTFQRQTDLMKQGVTTVQRLDEAHSRRDQAVSAAERSHDLVGRAEAEERTIAVARHQLDVLRAQRDLAHRQLDELRVERAKYEIRAPAVETVVQTQLIWPGELAQPGTPLLSVLDPRDKYVQIYVPVADAARVRVGSRVEIELDSEPGRRVPGEVSFVADQANFTPEKIETRSDRLGQVYRAKVRILEEVERFQPGTEGNVYLAAQRSPATETASSGAAAHATP